MDGVLVFGMRVCALIAVRVTVGLLFVDVQGVPGVHTSEGHPQPRRRYGEAGFERPVEGQAREALGEVDVDRGVYDHPDVARPDCCGWWCGGGSVRQGAQFAVGGRPEESDSMCGAPHRGLPHAG